MAGKSTFDTLVDELSKEERKSFLDKVRTASSISGEPLTEIAEQEEPVDLVREYTEAGFFVKLMLFFRAVFSGKEKYELLEEYLLERYGREVERLNPGLMSVHEELFLQEMYGELDGLRQAAEIFRVPLETALGSRKKMFTAFLGSFEMEVLHSRLMEETDPFRHPDHYRGLSDSSVRSALEMKLDDLFGEMTKDDRERMAAHFRVLHAMKRFADFPFAAVLGRFENSEAAYPRACYMRSAAEDLEELAGILAGLSVPPDPKVLQALFLFLYEKELEDNDFDIEDRIKRQLERSDTALNTIRNFNKNVPLVKILKYAKKNINYVPAAAGGGENWLTLYKKFWDERVSGSYKAFIEENRKTVVIEDTKEFLETDEYPFLEHYSTAEMSTSVELRHRYSVAFINAFVKSHILDTMNRPIKLVLIDGEFYKDQNRKDFTDAYNGLLQVEEQVKTLERDLGSRGHVRHQLEEIEKEIIPVPLKKKKMRQTLSKLEGDAAQIVQAGVSNMKLLHDVMYGILHGQVGGRFDTLSNLSYLGGTENAAVRRKIGETITALNRAIELTEELNQIE